MAYMNYSRAMYRTGFRPYGATNPWAASQLNGYSTTEAALSGYLGQSHPFEAEGGWRLHGLGQNKPFAPWTLHGLGAAICLDETENTIACTSPDCKYGDCGSTDWQTVGGSLCLDKSENQIACTSPECTYGDCVAPKGVAINLPPGPSPRTTVPPWQAPPTSPGYKPPTGTIIKGVPDVAIFGMAALFAITLIGGGGGRRR